ncbi:hypothetical protein [Streptomyces litchfieldiae]|uniref:Uncharacterized protein n=1 Tax=Streptomyces litchfieldiae TaxID=3075543 RepID=A0ABU2N151_9ACTN|nr:hypothetical protein [Streptomyces sp. DSM 44938]MDT0347614.1 hypothetical protein [Streptomyces sp. DSM 44938]
MKPLGTRNLFFADLFLPGAPRCQALLTDDLDLDLPPKAEAMWAAALDWDRDQALRLIAAHALATEDGEEHRARRCVPCPDALVAQEPLRSTTPRNSRPCHRLADSMAPTGV